MLDTCVLYPTVMREVVLGVAREGAFTPIWSPRILEEWVRAARKLGPAGEAQARAESAMVGAAFPGASVPVADAAATRFWLPDKDDVHVLATAVDGSADAIMTLNAKDFPRNILAEEGLERVDPDGYLYQLWLREAGMLEGVAQRVLVQARAMSGEDWDMRALLKKARLPRCAKALG